jgi:hypothetical protein
MEFRLTWSNLGAALRNWGFSSRLSEIRKKMRTGRNPVLEYLSKLYLYSGEK